MGHRSSQLELPDHPARSEDGRKGKDMDRGYRTEKGRVRME